MELRDPLAPLEAAEALSPSSKALGTGGVRCNGVTVVLTLGEKMGKGGTLNVWYMYGKLC